MTKRLLFLPLLSALFWASCRDPSDQRSYLPGAERDARAAICAFALACAGLVVASEIEKRSRQS